MVIGETGLGKSTFVNTLFLTDIYNSEHPGPSCRTKSSIEVGSTKVLLQVLSISGVISFALPGGRRFPSIISH